MNIYLYKHNIYIYMNQNAFNDLTKWNVIVVSINRRGACIKCWMRKMPSE